MKRNLLAALLLMSTPVLAMDPEAGEVCFEYSGYTTEKDAYEAGKRQLASQGIDYDKADPKAKRAMTTAKAKFEIKKRAYEKDTGRKFTAATCATE